MKVPINGRNTNNIRIRGKEICDVFHFLHLNRLGIQIKGTQFNIILYYQIKKHQIALKCVV